VQILKKVCSASSRFIDLLCYKGLSVCVARLDPKAPIKPGVFTVWVVARSAPEAVVLEKISRLNTVWNKFTTFVNAGFNSLGGASKFGHTLHFPPSQKIGGVWIPRKGFDKTPPKDVNAPNGALYFLLEFKKAVK
jgi:hypothetical protein